MIVYRLSNGIFRKDLYGIGAKIAGGRWNSKEVAILYTAESRALCTAELAVHTPLGIVPKDYYLLSIEFPDTVDVLTIKEKVLSSDWRSFPHPHSTQEIGNKFIADGAYLVMKVPSAVIQGDHNYLFNPNHKLFSKVRIINSEIYGFDKRLFIKE